MPSQYNLGTATGRITTVYDGTGVGKAKKDFKDVDDSAKKSSAGLKKTGDAAGVAGGAIALGLGLATKVAIDFEKQVSAIGAVSGASEKDLERLRSKALQLGSDTSFGASEAALAMEELAKAGIGVDDILNGAADATVALAAAGGVELPEAAELAADAMTSFGLSAADMPKIADQIAGAANASSIGVSQFGQSLKQVGAVANLVGISFADTATAIALLGANGIKGSDAGTSLKTMLSNLIPSTAKARDEMKSLGIITRDGANAFVDARGNMKPLGEIADILQDKTKNLTATQKQMALETIFGSDAIRAAAILTKSGAEGFDKMAASMGKVTAEEVAAKRLDNTAGAIEQLKGSAETAAIGLAQALLPAIVKITKALTTVTNAFNQLSPSTKNTITTVALVVSGILLLVFAITKIIAAAKAFMVVWRLLNLSFLASPVGLIIIAIVALVAVIVLIATKTTWFQDLWNTVWGFIKKVAGAVADWFMKTLVPSFKRAWEQLVKIFQFYWKIVNIVLDLAVAYFKFWWGVIETVFKAIWTAIKFYFTAVQFVIRTAVNAIVSLFQNWLQGVKVAIAGIKAVIGTVQKFFTDMRNAVIERIKNLISAVATIRTRITSAIGNLGRLLYNKGRELIQGLIDGIMSMINRVRNAASSVVSGITRFLPGSPAKEGPLSGRGYVLKRGIRMGEDFAVGITTGSVLATDAMEKSIQNLANVLPSNAAPVVQRATPATSAPTPLTRTIAAPATAPSITIENINIDGTWDLGDADVPRRFVGRLHTELDRYAKGYR